MKWGFFWIVDFNYYPSRSLKSIFHFREIAKSTYLKKSNKLLKSCFRVIDFKYPISFMIHPDLSFEIKISLLLGLEKSTIIWTQYRLPVVANFKYFIKLCTRLHLVNKVKISTISPNSNQIKSLIEYSKEKYTD